MTSRLSTVLTILMGLGSCADAGPRFEGRGRSAEYLEGRIVAILGTESGPQMLGGRPLHAARDLDGGYVLVDGRQAVRVGDTGHVGQLGRNGQGPGEYRFPGLIRVDGQGHIWIFDYVQSRAMAFLPSGELVGELSFRAAATIFDAGLIPDGGLAVVGTGSGAAAGYLLHVLEEGSDDWRPLPPTFDVGSISTNGVWLRKAVRAPDAERLILIDRTRYRFTEVDISTGEEELLFDGSGSFWDSLREHDGEEERFPFLQDVRLNDDGTAWALITIPVASVDRRRRIDSMSRSDLDRPDNDAPDQYRDSVLELIDLETGAVLRTIITPRFSSMILGSEPTIGHYAGDLPYPRLHVVQYDTPSR